MRVLVAGDTHGNTRFVCDYLLPVAAGVGAQMLLQLGDFGFWEHTAQGAQYLDDVSAGAQAAGVPVRFLRGNHDNIELLIERYHHPENLVDGCYQIRPHLLHIPDGHRFELHGVSFAAFGGAYSIDKQQRLNCEQQRRRAAWAKEYARRDAGLPPTDVVDPAGTFWFPGEELTDAQMDELLRDPAPVDVCLSHDKPRAASPGNGFKDLPDCMPNQDRLQRALSALTPRLWLHGHLHHRYEVSVPTAGWQDRWCSVVGLGCDDAAAPRFMRPADAWVLLELFEDPDVPVALIPGGHESLQEQIGRALDRHHRDHDGAQPLELL